MEIAEGMGGEEDDGGWRSESDMIHLESDHSQYGKIDQSKSQNFLQVEHTAKDESLSINTDCGSTLSFISKNYSPNDPSTWTIYKDNKNSSPAIMTSSLWKNGKGLGTHDNDYCYIDGLSYEESKNILTRPIHSETETNRSLAR